MSRLSKSIFAGLLLGAFGLALCFLRPVQDLEEHVGLGLLFKLRGDKKPPPEVLIVSIDKESAEHLKVSANPSRWPRSLHASLVEKLTLAGARLIVFDVYFVESRSPDEDRAFATILSKSGNVILGEAVRARDLTSHTGPPLAPIEHRLATLIKPVDVLAQAAIASAPFVVPRLPVRVNRYWTFQPNLGYAPTSPVIAFQLYSLPLYGDFRGLLKEASPTAVARLSNDPHLAVRPENLSGFIRKIRESGLESPAILRRFLENLDRSNLPSSEGQRYRTLKSLAELYYGEDHRYLNFYGPPRTIRTIPFHKVLLPEENTQLAAFDLKDKVVFVGLSETLLSEAGDSFYTVFSDANGLFLSGVEIVATAFANLLEGTSVTPIDSFYYLLLALSWGLLIGIACCTLGPFTAGAVIITFGSMYLAATELVFAANGVWLPVVIPLFIQAPMGYLGVFLWNYVEIRKEKQNIRKALGFYVPDDVARQLAKDILDLKKTDQAVNGICMFTDIRKYTTVSEILSPIDLSQLMNRYLTAVLEPIKKNGGVVIDMAGDSILAIWKSQNLDQRVRRQACAAAIEVSKALRQFNSTKSSVELPTRVGIHAGPIFLGNIGAADDYRYGARGDTVNTASRLENLNKQLGTEILVSKEVFHGLDGFLAREAGGFLLRGKNHPVVVYDLLGAVTDASEAQQTACTLFLGGLEAFRSRSWDEAEEKFRRAMESCPEHGGLPQLYLSRCQSYKLSAPRQNWDGSIAVEEN